MTRLHPIVFLVDVDNTLLDNDGIQQDLKDHLERAYGRDVRDRYWRILEDPRGSVLRTRLPRLSGSLAALSRRASTRSGASVDVRLPDRLPFRWSAVPMCPQGIEAAKGFRAHGYPVRWRRRLSASQSRTGGPFRCGRWTCPHLYP